MLRWLTGIVEQNVTLNVVSVGIIPKAPHNEVQDTSSADGGGDDSVDSVNRRVLQLILDGENVLFK